MKNHPKAEKAMQSVSAYCKKTVAAFKKTGKWISRVSQTIFQVSKHFCGLKSQELRMKKECMRLGELAYNRWKRKKAMSLQEHLNMIKELDLSIQSRRQTLSNLRKKLNSLFRFRTHYSSIQPKKEPPKEEKTVVEVKENIKEEIKTVNQSIEVKEDKSTLKTSSADKPKKNPPAKKTVGKPASAKTRKKVSEEKPSKKS